MVWKCLFQQGLNIDPWHWSCTKGIQFNRGIQADVCWILLFAFSSFFGCCFLDIYNWTGRFVVCLAQSHGLILQSKQSYRLKSSLLVILKTRAVSKHWAFWDIFTFWILDVCYTNKYSPFCQLCLPHIGIFFPLLVQVSPSWWRFTRWSTSTVFLWKLAIWG